MFDNESLLPFKTVGQLALRKGLASVGSKAMNADMLKVGMRLSTNAIRLSIA